MRRHAGGLFLGVGLLVAGCGNTPADLEACVRTVWAGLRPVAEDRAQRFLGKVGEDRARCRGGARAVALRPGPWVDWPHYWATGDAGSADVSVGRGTPLPPAGPARDRRSAHRSRVPARRAAPLQPLRQQRHVSGLRARPRRHRWPRAPDLARDAAAAGSPALRRRGRLRRAALRRRAGAPPDADGDLQRHPEPPHGIGGHAVRPERRVRGDLPGSRPHGACPEPSRHAPRPAPA